MMSGARILVVEDDPSIQTLLHYVLQHAGFAVEMAASAEEAAELLKQSLPDLLLLDWMLPGLSGEYFVKRLRQDARTRHLPVILLTARSSVEDKELAFNNGADDFVVKPFANRELLARINALLRRSAPQKTRDTVSLHGLLLDPDEQSIRHNGTPLEAGPAEFKLLHFFMTHEGRVYSRRQLLDLVWGDHVFVEERTVDVHIGRLRRILEPAGLDGLVQTVRGLGYRFGTAEAV